MQVIIRKLSKRYKAKKAEKCTLAFLCSSLLLSTFITKKNERFFKIIQI